MKILKRVFMLKKYMKLQISFLVFIFLLIMTACAVTEDIFKLEVSEIKTAEFVPLDKQENDNKIFITWEQIEKENATYWFDDIIEHKKREEIINNAEIISKKLQEKFTKNIELSYYISPNVYDVVIDGNIYINEMGITNDMTNLCVQTIYALTDTMSHYGLVYGLSRIVLDELQLQDIDLSQNDSLIEICKKHKRTGILDLTLPFFSKMYATDVQIEEAKELAISISKYIFDTKNEEGLLNLISISSQMTNEFDNLYVDYCNEWLKSIGSEEHLEVYPLLLKYSIYGDIYYPVAISTKWITYCFHNGYKEYYKILKFDNSYLKTKEVIVTLEKEMEDIREFLPIKYSEKNAKGLICYFDHKIDRSHSTGYKKFICRYLQSYIHEYAHNVYLEYGYENNFMREGLAEYCESKFGIYYNITNKNYYYSKHNSNNTYIKNIVKIYDEYMKNNNLEFDIFEFLEVSVFYDLKTLGEKAWENEQFKDYDVPALFTNYLIEQYGIKTYMKVFKNFKYFNKYFKESYPNMQKKYIDSLFEKYEPYMD